MLVVAIETVEHLDKSPLGPFVVFRVAGPDFTVPVEGEPDFIHLFPVATDVFLRGDGWVLSGLDGILLCGQTIRVISHGMQDIESFQMFVTGIDVGSDVA